MDTSTTAVKTVGPSDARRQQNQERDKIIDQQSLNIILKVLKELDDSGLGSTHQSITKASAMLETLVEVYRQVEDPAQPSRSIINRFLGGDK